MKLIDLLNKKINDEELPKKIKYDDNVFVYNNEQNDYIYEYGNISFCYDYCNPIYNFADCLATFNKEIEIIEEDKKIEKIDKRVLSQNLMIANPNAPIDEKWKLVQKLIYDNSIEIEKVKNKINELIEEIEKLKGKSE